jgi:hypothetical protein
VSSSAPIPSYPGAVTETGSVRPLASSSLEAFFHQAIARALRQRRVQAAEGTVHYLVQLLTCFSRSENLFDYSEDGIQLRPLAHLYAQALRSGSVREQCLMLRRLGDVALFIAGMFSGFFHRRRALVGMDYYIAMGERAYGSLLQGRVGDPAGVALVDVFAQLSGSFSSYVGVLSEVGDAGGGQTRDRLQRVLARPGTDGGPELEHLLDRRSLH